MSGENINNFPEGLILDTSGKGEVIRSLPMGTVVETTGVQAGDDIVEATIHLDHLRQNEVHNILKALEPYDSNMKVVTKKEFSNSTSLSTLGLGLQDSSEVITGDIIKKTDVDISSEKHLSSLSSLAAKLHAAQAVGSNSNGLEVNDLPNVNFTRLSADADAVYTLPSLVKASPNLDGTLTTPNAILSSHHLRNHNATLDIDKPQVNTDNVNFTRLSADADAVYTLPSLVKASPDLDGTLTTPNVILSSHHLSNHNATLDIDKPQVNTGNVNFTRLSADADAGYTLPSLVKASPDLDGNLTMPNVILSSHHLSNHNATLDIDKPQVKTGNAHYKAPHFSMPKFDVPMLETPVVDGDLNLPSVNGESNDLNLSTPNVDFNRTSVDLNGPKVDLNGPGVKLGTPDADIDVSADPFKRLNPRWRGPHLKLKKPKLPGAKADVDLDAGLSSPEVDLAVPKVEGGLQAPKIDVNMPNAHLKGPELDIHEPHLDGKFVWPHQKWKIPKIKGPKADLDVDAGLSTPNLDVSTPKLGSGINAQMALPKADLKRPDLDIENPNVGIGVPVAKKNWHLKLKKPKAPDLKLDTDVSTPDIGLSVPTIDGAVDAPDVDLNLPKANLDVNAPNVDMEAPSGRVKFPTLKKPKFWLAGPKVKTPNVDLDTDMKTPDLSLSTSRTSLHGPDVNLPKADVDVKTPDIDASGKIKWPTMKKPKWSLSGPKINGPDLDANVSTPDLSFTGPKLDTELNAPDLKLKTADLNGPNLDIDADAPSGKFKWLKKIGTLKIRKSDIDGDIKVPDVDVNAPDVDLRTPDVDISPNIKAPDLNFRTPNANIRGPNLDLDGSDANIEPIDAKLKLPKIKMPKWPKVKGPQVDTNLKAPNVDANVNGPNLDIDTPNLGLKTHNLFLSSPKVGGTFDAPDVNLQSPEVSTGNHKFLKLKSPFLSGPKFEKPNLDIDANVKGPHLNPAPLDINTPHLSLSGPKIDGGFAAPNVSLPKADFNGAHVDLPSADMGLGRLNVSSPHITNPGVDINLPKADINVKNPDLSLGNLHAPNFGTKLPNVDLEAPDVRLNSQVPNVGINIPTADLKGPDAQLKTPVLGLDSKLGEFALPHYKLPKLDLSSPGVEVPSVHPSLQAGLDTPHVNIGTPKADANISVPAVNLSGPKLRGSLKGPEVDMEADLEKPKLPHFKVPKLNFSGSKTKQLSPKLSLDGSVSPPVISSPEIAGDVEIKDSLKSKFKWPFKWGLKSHSIDTPDYNGNAEVNAPKFRIHTLPRNCIETKTETSDIFNLSKFDNEAKDYVMSKGIRLPVVNAPSRNGEKIDIMERLKMAMGKLPSTNTSPTEDKTVSLKMASESLSAFAGEGDSSFIRGGTFKVEKPEFPTGLIDPARLADETDESNKLSVGLSNMLGLDV